MVSDSREHLWYFQALAEFESGTEPGLGACVWAQVIGREERPDRKM